MGLIVPYYSLFYDAVLFLAIFYIWLFFLKRWNRYMAELRPFIRNAAIFLGFAVAGRLIDLITDFVALPHLNIILTLFYGVSIVGVIYTMINYILFSERYYLPPAPHSESGASGKLTGSYIFFMNKGGIGKLINFLRELGGTALIFARSPDRYKELGDSVALVWITQATDRGIPPTKLHVLQERAIRFMREKPGGVTVLDGMEYLLMYNDFPALFRFLVAVKDYAVLNNSAFVVVVDPRSIGDKERALLLNEFEPL